MNSRRFVSFIIVLVLLLNFSLVLAKDSQEELARDKGDAIGYMDGYIKGLENASDKLNTPVSLVLPKKSEVISKYSSYLIGENQSYRDRFYIGYIEGFIRGYEETIGSSGSNIVIPEIKINYAEALGLTLGEIYGFRDFNSKVSSNWRKALPANSKIVSMFNMEKQTSSYRSNFLSTFRRKFQEGYEEGFEKANLEPIKISLESGLDDGETIGSVLGNIYGAKDYFENKSINYLRDLPSDINISKDYSLNNDSKEYKDGFLIGFKRAYEESYNETYRESNINIHLANEEVAYENGVIAGQLKGEVLGTKDFMENRANDWKRNQITSSIITRDYNLIYQSAKYRQGFISGFWQGFSQGYTDTYIELSQGQVESKSIVENIAISGGYLSSPDNNFLVVIDKGTYYNNVSLSIETLSNNNFSIDNNRYIKASNFYKIDIGNSSKELNNSKPIQLSFEYYDNYRGGIYKRVDDRWVYISSTIEDGYIVANVNPNTLSNRDNIYCVLIDKQSPILTDIMSHWAQDEINTYIRRNIIYGYSDNTFKPEREISRIEFLTLLSRQYDWKLNNNIDNIGHFKDFHKFGNKSNLISYALNEGYIMGYKDDTFRPNDPITYKEIETIMARVLKDENFKWYNTSSRILYEKKVKSNSYKSINNKINRAEVVYMLNILNQWRY